MIQIKEDIILIKVIINTNIIKIQLFQINKNQNDHITDHIPNTKWIILTIKFNKIMTNNQKIKLIQI